MIEQMILICKFMPDLLGFFKFPNYRYKENKRLSFDHENRKKIFYGSGTQRTA